VALRPDFARHFGDLAGFSRHYDCKDKGRRMKSAIEKYEEIVAQYRAFMNTRLCGEILNLFDEKYPDNGISDVKKIDFILWQNR
jgi:hypothetical protein